MSTANKTVKAVRHEKMRIAGQLVDGETGKRVEVYNPYDNTLVGTVPRASRAQVANAFETAANYTPTLTRYERQQILSKTAHALVARKDAIADLITAECGISKKDSLYEVGRAFDVFSLAGQLCILDDGEIFSCDLNPAWQTAQDFYPARTTQCNRCDHPVQSPFEHDFAQDRPGNCHQQLYGGQTH